ncbi:uncharacterized protein Bfra_000381 [Botrytis fragariae]|uniref:Uncharacterized protein n=1 Tax=Botrytis fragariae TaxID=1964551 RepID=A0A8H6B2Z1_9HELO|nr:uncharacterized protein Bfra_000381 [Botrytis fragariae]KAF5878215.1 hypothetical protein Bfra_000381 [Botrytis fragariae]
MSKKYDVHHTFDSRGDHQRPITSADISDYIPLQAGRENESAPTPFDVLEWLSVFYGQKVPPLPVIRMRDLEEVPDQRLQETIEDYQLFTPTVRGVRLNPFTEIGIEGFPLIEDTIFNIVRSYPADEQYQGPHNLIWLVSNSYWRAVAWAMYGNWELWPQVKAQHRMMFDQVLATPKHPRHTLYRNLNDKRKGHNNLNIKERLGIPYCAIRHDDIQQVTADMYGIFLVIFTCRPAGQAVNIPGFGTDQSPRHFAPTIRGEFGRPHKFIRLSIGTVPEKYRQYPDASLLPLWQMYEPMMLNMPNFRHSDFKYIRPTFENTRESLPMAASIRPTDFNGVNHPWRAVNVPWGQWFGVQQKGLPDALTQPANWPAAFPHKAMSLTIAMGCILLGKGDPKDPRSWAHDSRKIIWIRPDKTKRAQEAVEESPVL